MIDRIAYIEKELNKFKERCKNKKVVIFGTGSKIEKLQKICDFTKLVDYYVDNDCNKWGKICLEKEIKSPETLISEDVNLIIVLILSEYTDDINRQLINYGLMESNILNINQILDFNNILDIHIKYTNKYIDFLNTIPKHIFCNRKINNEKRIGIVIIPAEIGSWCYYSITLFLLLFYRGYNVTLIIDDLHGIEDKLLYEGTTKIFNEITNKVILYMKEMINNLEIMYISDVYDLELSDDDIKEIDYLSQNSTIWQQSLKFTKSKHKSYSDIYNIFHTSLVQNFKKVNCFFEKTKFDVLQIYTGLHKEKGLYSLVGKKNDIRVTTYDSTGNDMGPVFFTSEGITGHMKEIVNIINQNMLSESEKNKVLTLAIEEFKVKRKKTKSDGVGNYQIVSDDDLNETYDIIIPLNIAWDSAALGKDKLFKSFDEWLFETVEFILHHTNASVLIREHPAILAIENAYYYQDYGKLLYEKHGNNSRYRFVKYDEKVNTYKQVEKSKLILPYTSTVGIEAALMKKKVIMHTNCYYTNFDFVESPDSKEDYFTRIKEVLNGYKQIDNKEIQQALLSLYLLKYVGINTQFNEISTSWMQFDFLVINNMSETNKIIQTIAENIPYIYLNLKEYLEL